MTSRLVLHPSSDPEAVRLDAPGLSPLAKRLLETWRWTAFVPDAEAVEAVPENTLTPTIWHYRVAIAIRDLYPGADLDTLRLATFNAGIDFIDEIPRVWVDVETILLRLQWRHGDLAFQRYRFEVALRARAAAVALEAWASAREKGCVLLAEVEKAWAHHVVECLWDAFDSACDGARKRTALERWEAMRDTRSWLAVATINEWARDWAALSRQYLVPVVELSARAGGECLRPPTEDPKP